ncbi:MAG TPA: hypothetical protein PLY87_10780 [Planctomycetaceae bacterium]|nr:hypothetical protein [Planctomycetaceae bacterium]
MQAGGEGTTAGTRAGRKPNAAVRFVRAVICCLLILLTFETTLAQDTPLVRMKMELMCIRNRSSGPLPVHIKLEYNRPQILTGDLILRVYDSVDIISRDDLMATLLYEDITLASADYEMNIVLPPLKTAVTQNWAVEAEFVTKNGTIPLSARAERPTPVEPFDLLTTSPMERGVLLCSCFKDSRRNSASANRNFLEKALSLDNYNPLYAIQEAERETDDATKPAGVQQLEKIGHTVIYFAGQWSSRDLPQDPLSYCAFDVVLLSDESLASLQKEQLDGLSAWVRAGGSVCIVPDVPMKPQHLEFLRKLFEKGTDSSAKLTLDSDARLFVMSDETDPILMNNYGLGRAVLLPNVEDLSVRLSKEDLGRIVAFLWKVRKEQPVWKGENWTPGDLLSQLKFRGINAEQDEKGIFVRDAQYRYVSSEQVDGKYYLDSQAIRAQYHVDDRIGPQVEPLLAIAEQALLPSDVEMVPTWIIGMILMGYVMAIGPADYFLLGWLKMRKYTWVLFPVITAVFTLLTVMVANAYMGSDDTGGKLIITDLGDNGIPIRQTTLETLYYSAQANVTNDHKGELVVLSEDNFSGLNIYDPYGQMQQQSQDAPLSYSGHFPQNYSVSHRVQQWSPVSLRTLSLEPQESKVPPIDWNDGKQLTTPEGRTLLTAQLRQYATTNQAECHAAVYHQLNLFPLVGDLNSHIVQPQAYRGNPYYYATSNGQPATAQLLNMIPTVKPSNENFFGIVSQIAPHGAGSLEDLAFLDDSDPEQWALVIVAHKGDDFQVFRKLYFIESTVSEVP